MKIFKFLVTNVGIFSVLALLGRMMDVDLSGGLDFRHMSSADMRSLHVGMSSYDGIQFVLVQIAMALFTYVLYRDFVFRENVQSGSVGLRFAFGYLASGILFGLTIGFFFLLGISVGNPLAVVMFLLLGLVAGFYLIFRLYDRWVFA